MSKLIFFGVITLLFGCQSGGGNQAFKTTLKDYGINELNCIKEAAGQEAPVVIGALTGLLPQNTDVSNSLINAWWQQFPQLVTCSVQSVLHESSKLLPVGMAMRAGEAQRRNTTAQRANEFLKKWMGDKPPKMILPTDNGGKVEYSPPKPSTEASATDATPAPDANAPAPGATAPGPQPGRVMKRSIEKTNRSHPYHYDAGANKVY